MHQVEKTQTLLEEFKKTQHIKMAGIEKFLKTHKEEIDEKLSMK